MGKEIIRRKFWPPYWNGNAPELTKDQLGWNSIRRRDAGSDDVKDNFDFHVVHSGWDLSFYYVDKDRFYYIDLMNKEIYCRRDDPDWNHEYDYDRVSVYDLYSSMEDEPIFEFENPDEIWEHFRIDGKDLAYILLHSVIWLST